MNLAGLELWAKDVHDVALALDSRQAAKGAAGDDDLVMVMSSGQVDDVDAAIRVSLEKALFDLLRRHGSP
jgi:hypothetical protein